MAGFTFGAAPAAPPAAPVPTTGGPQPYKPSFLDILQGVVFDGQSPAEAAMAARGRQYALAQQQLMMSALQNAPPDVRMAMMLNPGETGKAYADRIATHAVKSGETLVNGGPAGANFTAPMMGIDDKSGKPYALSLNNGSLSMSDLPSLGGGYKAEGGIVYGDRSGDVAGRYALPQVLAPGTRLRDFTPGINGGASAGLDAGQPVSGGPTSGAPRGVRNLNFGNLKALPHGHMWDGQTGVDDQGYAVFGDPTSGVKAADQNLQAYGRKGINTVAGVIGRWAPKGADGNPTSAYAGFVAQRMGVNPNDKIDLTDPKTRAGLLRGIFDFENGAQAMNSWRAPAGSVPSTSRNLAEGNQPRPLTAQERASWNISPEDHTPYAMGPDGKPVAVGNDVFGPRAQLDYTAQVTGQEPYKNYVLGRGYLSTMQTLIKQPGGFADLGLIEMAGKTVNPTVAIRPNMIEQYAKEVGWPDWLVGQVSSVMNHGGHLTQEGRNALMNIAQANVRSHYEELQPILKKVDHDAQRYGLKREDLIPDFVPMPDKPPAPYAGSTIPGAPVRGASPAQGSPLPPKEQLRPGQTYNLPNGAAIWTGTGFRPITPHVTH